MPLSPATSHRDTALDSTRLSTLDSPLAEAGDTRYTRPTSVVSASEAAARTGLGADGASIVALLVETRSIALLRDDKGLLVDLSELSGASLVTLGAMTTEIIERGTI